MKDARVSAVQVDIPGLIQLGCTTGGSRGGVAIPAPARRGLRSKQYTYAIYRKDHKEFLFDNQADPHQLHNLADSPRQQATMKSFRALLKKRMEELDDGFEAGTWYRDHWVKDRIITRVR